MSGDPAMPPGNRAGTTPVACEVCTTVDASKPARRLGLLDGKIHVPDNFDDPLPDEILTEFEG
jgi:hypothetical protein